MAINPFFDGRTPKIQKLEQEMKEAAAKRDNINYVLKCNILGRKPDYQDLYEQGLAELTQRREKTIRNELYQSFVQMPEQIEKEDREKTTKISYANFLRLTDSSSVNPYDAFDEKQYSAKMRILRQAGYDKLTIAKGKSMPIEQVKVSRVLNAFSKVYQTAMRWAEKQMKPAETKNKRKKTGTENRIIGKRKPEDRQPLLFHTEGRI